MSNKQFVSDIKSKLSLRAIGRKIFLAALFLRMKRLL